MSFNMFRIQSYNHESLIERQILAPVFHLIRSHQFPIWIKENSDFPIAPGHPNWQNGGL